MGQIISHDRIQPDVIVMEKQKLQVDKRIFEALALGLDKLQFAVVKLESCNGTGSISFSEASCEYEVLLDKKNYDHVSSLLL